MDFTLDQLRALDAIARTGSFAKAAADLHKVPSAISYAIQGLESALGIEVFDRTRRKAVLTPAGHRILEASRGVIGQAHALQGVAAELKDGWEPEFHVVVDGALPMAPLMRCVRRFADPDVPTCLRLDIEYQEGVVDRFESDPADVALVLGLAGDGDEVGLDCTPLGKLELLLVASSEHPLASGTADPETRSAYAELVVRDSSPQYAKRSKASFIGSRNVVYLSDFHAKRFALLEAAGFGWIPRHFIEADIKQGRLVQLNAEPSSWTYEPQIVVREGHRLGRGGQLFLDTMQA